MKISTIESRSGKFLSRYVNGFGFSLFSFNKSKEAHQQVQVRKKRRIQVVFAFLIMLSPLARAITIGPGPWIGTDKRGTAWYQEFQDWNKADLRALDGNSDVLPFWNETDTSRDLVAFYSRVEGDTVFFRVDFFDLKFGAELSALDLYVAIDCAPGGAAWLPDNVETSTSHPWEICVGVYGGGAGAVYNSSFQNMGWAWKGSYFRSDLDSVEFGINKFALTDFGWDGSSPFFIQVYTTHDGTSGGAGEVGGSDIVDTFHGLNRDTGTGSGHLDGAFTSDGNTGTAKYAAIAHANQSVATKVGTQGHVFTGRPDLDLYAGFVRTLDSAEMLNAPMNLHISGTLLMSFNWATQNPIEAGYPDRDGPTFLNRVKNFVTAGPGSLVGGVLAEHIMPYFEGEVNQKSIQQNSELLQDMFGLTEQDMKVMHTPERVIRSNTANPTVSPDDHLDGKTFEDIEQSGFVATYLDEVTHLHWWFYPNEQDNPGWDDFASGRWAGGGGNDEEAYHHKVHKINGVYTFMINDREDQSKFGNNDGGMAMDTRYTLLEKARHGDYAQITIVFDDWEAFAGNSFASSVPNNNADQWHNTLRWAANHQWIEIVNLESATTWAQNDPNWVIDHGYVYDKATQTYEWLKRAAEYSYDNWYYGGAIEENFYNRVPNVVNGWHPEGMKKYGDMNSPGTLIRDSWDVIQQIESPNLKKLSEWSYSAMVYETAWHDENPPGWWPPVDKPWLAWPDSYQSKNYQITFNRSEENAYEDDAPKDYTSSWALSLHGHVRDMGVMKDAGNWVQEIKAGTQGALTWAYAADLDDDQLDEYVLRNDKVYLCFERWGGRLVKAFVYDPAFNGGDAREVIGAPITFPPSENENEYADSTRCSVFKDRYSSGMGDNRYVDNDYGTSVQQGVDSFTFTSQDGRITKKVSLPSGVDAVTADYTVAGEVGTLYTRHGVGPNQFDLMLHGHDNLLWIGETGYRGLRNTQGGEVFIVLGQNAAFTEGHIASAGWEHREQPLTEQFETYNTANNFSVSVAFSEATAEDLGGAGGLKAVEWIGDVSSWPVNGDISAIDDIWINIETYPMGAAVQAQVLYSTDDINWMAAPMSISGQQGQNDQWHVNLGAFPQGTSIQYAIVVQDEQDADHWANNNGENYRTSVGATPPVLWMGDVYHSPSDNELKPSDTLWVNLESYPAFAAFAGVVVYSTDDGATWTEVPMLREGLVGQNDWWSASLGSFPEGTTVRYAARVRDGKGVNTWENNGGQDYKAQVGNELGLHIPQFCGLDPQVGDEALIRLNGRAPDSLNMLGDFIEGAFTDLIVRARPIGTGICLGFEPQSFTDTTLTYTTTPGDWSNAQVVEGVFIPAVFDPEVVFNHYTYSLPSFPAGTTVQFWLAAENIEGVSYAQEAGQDYVFTVVANADSDNDGLNDEWEQTYFGDLSQGASDNEDGDGPVARPIDNMIEFKTGTDPLVPNDHTGFKLIWTPSYPLPGDVVTLSYFYVNEGNPLFGKPVYGHVGQNEWQNVFTTDQFAINNGVGRLETTITVPLDATEINIVFNDQAGTWDNNNGQDWSIKVQPTP